jgi:hypothetical protein
MQWPTRTELLEFLQEMGAGLLLVALLYVYALGVREVLEFLHSIPLIGWILVR